MKTNKVYLIIIINIYLIIYCHKIFSYQIKNFNCIENNFCYKSFSSYKELQISKIVIQSHHININFPKEILFIGNANFLKKNMRFSSEKIFLYKIIVHKNNKKFFINSIKAKGDIKYQDDKLIIKGRKAWFNLENQYGSILDIEYNFIKKKGYGKAKKIKMYEKKNYVILENTIFNPCFTEKYSWNILAKKIIYNKKKEILKIWNAYFRIRNFIIFYFPYWKISIGNKSYSGFLTPHMQHYENQFNFSLPYYLYIKSNLDFTITPIYTYKKNLQYISEIRYLNKFGFSFVKFNFIPQYFNLQNLFKKRLIKSDFKFFNLYNEYYFLKKWRLVYFYLKNNNISYFNKLTSNFDFKFLQEFLTKKLNITFYEKKWILNFEKKTFQVIPSKEIKNIVLNINFKKKLGIFNTIFYLQKTNFFNKKIKKPITNRLHIESIFNFPFIINNENYFSLESKILFTHYKQNRIKYLNSNLYNKKISLLKKNVNRIIPQLKLDTKFTILKKNNFIKKNYILKVFTPHIQYFYSPFRNQKNIYIYDTIILKEQYTNFFYTKNNINIDRIYQKNLLKTGLNISFYKNFFKKFNLSLAKNYSFKKSPKNFFNDIQKNSWLLELYLKVNSNLNLSTSLQYNTNYENYFVYVNSFLQYSNKKNMFLQLHYRYLCPKYIIKFTQENINQYNLLYAKNISEFTLIGNMPFLKNFSIIGIYNFNLKLKKLTNNILGIKYKNCSYSIQLNYEKKVNHWNNIYDKQFLFKIELYGLLDNI